MKRRDSSKSVASLKVDTDATSDVNSTDLDSTGGLGKEKKKRFARKKKVGVEAIVTPGEAAAAMAMFKKRGKGRKGKKGEEEQSEGKKRNETKLGRRRTKRDYTFEDDDEILGLVQIEVKGAKDLPRYKNSELACGATELQTST